MVQFRRPAETNIFGKSTGDGSPNRPPNYLSRRVQWRIMVLVFMFMAVLMLMTEARKASNWEWMWHLTGGGRSPNGTDGDSSLAGPINTRPNSSASSPDPWEPAGPVVSGLTTIAGGTDRTDRQEWESLDTALKAGWDRVLSSLRTDQRDRLFSGLWQVRRNQALGSTSRASWPDLVGRLDHAWTTFLDEAFLTLAQDDGSLSADQRRMGLAVLERLKVIWGTQHEALQQVSEEIRLTETQRAELTAVQAQLDTYAMGRVEDNTVLRGAEYHAWYRTWERIESRSERPEPGVGEESGRVTFVELFSQPDDYRGKWVTVRGMALEAYYIRSPSNPFGLSGYYAFWIRPADGAPSPMVVYCRQLPPGFPQVTERNAGGKGVSMRVQATFDGIFFKRLVYASQSGPNLAPLVLGRITRWESESQGSSARTGKSPPPISPVRWLAMVIMTALTGTVIAVWVWRTSRQRVLPRRSFKGSPPDVLDFDQAVVRPGIEQTLGELAGGDAAGPTAPEQGDR